VKKLLAKARRRVLWRAGDEGREEYW